MTSDHSLPESTTGSGQGRGGCADESNYHFYHITDYFA